MSRMQKVVRVTANLIVMAFVCVILALFIMPSYRQGEPFVSTKAEDFALMLNGKSAHLSDLRGNVVVLNFWASYCGSCVEEIPSLDRLQHRIAQRNGVVLAVSIDENPGAYRSFLANYPVGFPTYCSEGTKIVALHYSTSMIPETYVIDRKGYIIRKIIGPQQWDSGGMLEYFDAVLREN